MTKDVISLPCPLSICNYDRYDTIMFIILLRATQPDVCYPSIGSDKNNRLYAYHHSAVNYGQENRIPNAPLIVNV